MPVSTGPSRNRQGSEILTPKIYFFQDNHLNVLPPFSDLEICLVIVSKSFKYRQKKQPSEISSYVQKQFKQQLEILMKLLFSVCCMQNKIFEMFRAIPRKITSVLYNTWFLRHFHCRYSQEFSGAFATVHRPDLRIEPPVPNQNTKHKLQFKNIQKKFKFSDRCVSTVCTLLKSAARCLSSHTIWVL